MTSSSQDDFHRAFLAALLWSTTDSTDANLDDHYTAKDLHPHTANVLRKQCDAFWEEHTTLLNTAFAGDTPYNAAQAGHDFALSRNGHGAGFFDRGLDEVGDQLQQAAQEAGECDIYVGDDKKLYVSGEEPTRKPAKPKP